MMRIVIAEDEAMIRRGLVETIDWAGMGATVVGEAADGIEALAVVRAEQPDVLLADIRMPRLSGLDLAETLRAEGSHTAIVFLTSYAEFAYAQRAVRLGAADYLLKPVEEADIARVLAQLRPMEDSASRASAEDSLALVGWPQADAASQTGNPYVADVLAAIRSRYRERLSIDALADAAGVSASYLSRKLKEATGHTFSGLLARYRIAQSLPLLRAGRMRVYEVAEAAGFTDYKSFCQAFKKYLHESPRAWLSREGETHETL